MSNDQQVREKKWYQKSVVVLAAILFYFPIGLIWMWAVKAFNLWIRILLTLIPVALVALGVISIGFLKPAAAVNAISILGMLLSFGFTLGFVYLGYRLIKHFFLAAKEKKAKLRREANAFNQVIFDEFNSLGSTKEERKKTIIQLFESKQKTMHFQWLWIYTEQYDLANGGWDNDENCFLQIEQTRNLASMEPREREFLRSAMLLYNDGKLSNDAYAYYLFAFVNGNGKSGIVFWKTFTHKKELKDGPTVAKAFMDGWDASVDSAINNLLQNMEQLGEKETGDDSLKHIKNRMIGGGAWLSSEEINGTVFNGLTNFKLGLGQLEESNTILNYSGEGSLITIAPPGSGKTQCFVIPNMLSWPGAAVVLDIKGEIYSATSKWREKNVGKVYKFSPLDPANSHSYNPLVFIRQEVDYIWEDSRFLADMMIVPSGASDPFWENMARDVLTAAIAYVSSKNEPGDRAMTKVLDVIYGIGWDDMIATLKTTMSVAAMRQTGFALSDMDRKQRDSILKTAQSSLSAWQGERIGKVTKKSDWNPLELRNGNPTIYICINPNEIDSYLSVIRVFIAQHIRMLTSELPQRGVSPVLFMLDELPRLKKMPPVDEALNIGRQYGIKLWMFAQSYGQLKAAYPDPEGLLGSCVVRTFMNLPLNDELTTKISDQLGFREGPLDTSKQKLVEPLELAGPNYRDLILVLATNTKPAKVRKKFAFEDEEIKMKLATA